MIGWLELLATWTLKLPWVTSAMREVLVELPVICTGAVVSCCNVDLSFFKLLVVFCLELFSYEGLVSLFWETVVLFAVFAVSDFWIVKVREWSGLAEFWLIVVFCWESLLAWSVACTVCPLSKKKMVPKATVTNPTEIFLKLNFSFPLSLVIKNKKYVAYWIIKTKNYIKI